MKTIPTTEQIAHQLESLARRIAPTVALIITAVILTYNAGYRLGRAIHQANDWLAQHWPTRPATQPAPTQNVTLAEVIAETKTVVLVDDVVALRAQGLTQRAIAERLGVSRTTVRRRLAAV